MRAAPLSALAPKLAEGFRPYLLLSLLCLALFAPGLASLPPTDRDESRFMQATKQMIETGDFRHIRFQDEPRTKKPIGIYWLQAASVLLTRTADLSTAWPYRLPSALAAWIAVLATCQLGRRIFDPIAGLAAGAMLATTLVVVAEAHLAKTDAALLASVTLCFAALAKVYVWEKPKDAALPFWLALALGVLIKGPVIVLVVGMAVITLCAADRSIAWLRALHPLPAATIIVAALLSWFLLTPDAVGFVAQAVQGDIWPKIVGGQEGHGAPPGTHTLLALATAWPWSALAPFALVAAWHRRGARNVRFCLAWLIPAWLAFEVIPTKLPHYTLPLMPALMLLTAAFLRELPSAIRMITSPLGLIYRILWSWVAIALAVVVVVAVRRYGDAQWLPAAIAAVAAVTAGGIALAAFAALRPVAAGASLTAAGGVFAVTVIAGVAPHLSQLALSARIAAEAEPLMIGNAAVALADYHEPSAVFLLGTETILTDTAGAAAHLLAKPSALAIVPHDGLDAVRSTVAAAGERLEQIDEIDGYNYSRGRWQRLALVTARPQDHVTSNTAP